MTLIIETGAGVSGANSYISTADAQAYLDSREIVNADGMDVTPNLTDGLMLRAMDALTGIRWDGFKAAAANPLPWPRSHAFDCERVLIASDVIPDQIKEAQIWLAFYIESGSDPATPSTPAVKREKVDVIEVEYAVKDGETTSVSLLALPNVKSRLKCLINTSGGIDRA